MDLFIQILLLSDRYTIRSECYRHAEKEPLRDPLNNVRNLYAFFPSFFYFPQTIKIESAQAIGEMSEVLNSDTNPVNDSKKAVARDSEIEIGTGRAYRPTKWQSNLTLLSCVNPLITFSYKNLTADYD